MSPTWRTVSSDGLPPRGEAVVIAWRYGDTYHYAIAKWTGRRWMTADLADNEEVVPPLHWLAIAPPDWSI